jgi:hypothetical protein
MSLSVRVNGLQEDWAMPPAEPLDESMWHTWGGRDRVQEWLGNGTGVNGWLWTPMTLLLAAAGLWVHLTSSGDALPCLAVAGAMAAMCLAYRQRHCQPIAGRAAVAPRPVSHRATLELASFPIELY